MKVEMTMTLATADKCLKRGLVYDLSDELAAGLVRDRAAAATDRLTDDETAFYARLDDGAGRRCLFLPFVGEFGHQILTHIRIVHWHKASEKIVCCRPGEESLYPSAAGFVTDWIDDVPDDERIGTFRGPPPRWPALRALATDRGLYPVTSGGLSFDQELIALHPDQRIPFRPKWRGLTADVAIGTRRRALAPERNWPHWQRVADALEDKGYTFAVVGAEGISDHLVGEEFHTAGDTDAAIELLQSCRLYVGTDSGASHLASTVGAPMLMFREYKVSSGRSFVARMQRMNPNRLTFLPQGWDDPDAVVTRMLAMLSIGAQRSATAGDAA